MQEYLQRARLGEVMDALGFRTLALLVCLGWFIFLWGVRLPALCAGLSLFMLVMLLEKKTRDARLLRREKKLRVQIGGELFLEKLLMDPPVRAHFSRRGSEGHAPRRHSVHAPRSVRDKNALPSLRSLRQVFPVSSYFNSLIFYEKDSIC